MSLNCVRGRMSMFTDDMVRWPPVEKRAYGDLSNGILLPRTLVTEGGAPVNVDAAAAAAADMDEPPSCPRFCRRLPAAESCFDFTLKSILCAVCLPDSIRSEWYPFNAWYRARYRGLINALQAIIPPFLIFNTCFNALVAWRGVKNLPHQLHSCSKEEMVIWCRCWRLGSDDDAIRRRRTIACKKAL